MQHPSGAAGSYSRSPPACLSSACPARCETCSWAFCGAWPLSPVLVPSQGTHQPRGQGCWSLPCCPVRMIPTLTCGKGGSGGGGRQNPQHGALGASPLVGGFERGLGTARRSNWSGGHGASLISWGTWGYDNNHHVLLWMSLLQFLKGLGGGRINKYLHYSKGKKKKVLHTTAHKYTQLRV